MADFIPNIDAVALEVTQGSDQVRVVSSGGLWDKLAEAGGGEVDVRLELGDKAGEWDSQAVKFTWTDEPLTGPKGEKVYEEYAATKLRLKRYFCFQRYTLTMNPGDKVAILDRPYEGTSSGAVQGVQLG